MRMASGGVVWSALVRAASAALFGVVIAAGPVGVLAFAAGPVSASVSQDELDKIVLRNGRVIEGEILSETATEVRLNVVVAGISAPATYKRSDILEIVRAERLELVDEEATPAHEDLGGTTPVISASKNAPSVYLIRLEGEFGRDISPTPVRDAVAAAQREQPDFLVVYLNNRWGDHGHELPDDYQTTFDWFSVAERLVPIFTREIELNWEKQPYLVFWVRNAMGGAAFLPFVADEIYFHPQGRMGGVGTLEQMFEGVGDEVVRQKQRSLRLAMAQGLAIAGGYDHRLVTAMARRSYVLSYDIAGNLYERMPERPGEFVLTDNGEGENRDTMRQLVTGEGNDVLTLRADSAQKLGVSKGTALDVDELLEHMGILRNHVLVDGRSDQILSNWSRNVAQAERQLPRLWEDFNGVQGGGTVREQRQAIGTRIRYLQEMQNLYRRYGEAFNPFSEGVPNITDLELRIEQLRMQLLMID